MNQVQFEKHKERKGKKMFLFVTSSLFLKMIFNDSQAYTHLSFNNNKK